MRLAGTRRPGSRTPCWPLGKSPGPMGRAPWAMKPTRWETPEALPRPPGRQTCLPRRERLIRDIPPLKPSPFSFFPTLTPKLNGHGSPVDSSPPALCGFPVVTAAGRVTEGGQEVSPSASTSLAPATKLPCSHSCRWLQLRGAVQRKVWGDTPLSFGKPLTSCN